MINLFFRIYTNEEIIPIMNNNNNKYFDKNLINNFNVIEELFINKIKKINKNNYYYKISKLDYLLNETSNYLFDIFNIDIKKRCGIIETNLKDNKINYYVNDSNCILSNCNTKYKTIIKNIISEEIYNIVKYKENYYDILYKLFDILEPKGNLLFVLNSIYNNHEIDIIYLLSFMFNNIIIYNGIYIYCDSFRSNKSLIKKENIKNKKWNIEPKNNLDNLILYYNSIINNKIMLYNFFIKDKYDDYIDKYFLEIYNNISNNKLVDITFDIKIKLLKNLITFLKRIYINKSIIKINSSIKNSEGDYIYEIINKNKYKKCLEIGFAFGISAIYILSNKECNLISIDPYQKTQWNDNGVKLIKELNFSKRHKLIRKKNYEALPELLKKYGENSFDFIFIDGWHTFDYTLIDFFYANLLLKIGGIIVIDDALHPGVSDCITYLTKNYLFYEKIYSPTIMASYKKIENDNRAWNFHIK